MAPAAPFRSAADAGDAAPSFKRPNSSAPTPHLCVAGVCGVPLADLQAAFAAWANGPGTMQLHVPAPMQPTPGNDTAAGVSAAVAPGAHVFVSYATAEEALAAVTALTGQHVGGRLLSSIKFADMSRPKVRAAPVPVATSAEQLGIPGLQLLHDFVSPIEEAALLEAVDSHPWACLSKRRVQHYGYAFDYAKRGVDSSRRLGPLPQFLCPLLQRIKGLPGMPEVDQCTVNEYTPGVGLAAHIDTHSAFTGAILSLSLAGPCAMELRRGDDKRALLLPPRSLLVLGGEARYAWQHYIPHRRSDVVDGMPVPRAPRRISLTLRQVRNFKCDCAYPEYCDSQQAVLPPTRLQLLQLGLLQPAHAAHAASVVAESSPACSGGAAQPKGQVAYAAANGHALAQHSRGLGTGEGLTTGTPHANMAPTMLHLQKQLQDPRQQVQHLQPAPVQEQHQQGKQQQRQQHGQQQEPGPSASHVGQRPESIAQQLEAQHVHQVYDAIASHFSATRFAVWPKVRAFIESLPGNSIIADVGCGNGKYFGVRSDCAVLGSDMSRGLAEVAARRLVRCGIPSLHTPQADVLVADALQLPYRDTCCDAVLCIAVLHHISSVARRLKLLQELARVLRPGGRGLVTVWATEQEEPHKTLAKWTLFTNPADAAGACRSSQGSGGSSCKPQMREHVDQDHTSDGGPGSTASSRATVLDTSQQARPYGAPPTAAAGQDASTTAACSSSDANIKGPDYMVPWHLPLHRASSMLAKAGISPTALVADPPAAGTSTTTGQDGTAGGGAAEAAGQQSGCAAGPSVVLDSTKNAVVLQRYYHLFEPGELEALVQRVPSLVLQRSYYDRSNWCAIFGRCTTGA